MVNCFVACSLILASILKTGKRYVAEEEEEEFMWHCREFFLGYTCAPRPPPSGPSPLVPGDCSAFPAVASAQEAARLCQSARSSSTGRTAARGSGAGPSTCSRLGCPASWHS